MAKKVLLRDWNNDEVLPITRGELVLDSSGKEAFRSNEFLATTSQPGLMSSEDKYKIVNMQASSIANALTLKINNGSVEGTNLYTYNGSAAKTLNIVAGDNIILTPTDGVLSISATTSATVDAYTKTESDNRYLRLSGGTLTGGLTISAGNLIVKSDHTVTGDLYPKNDGVSILGQGARRWANVYTVLINGGTPIHSGNIGSYNAGSASVIATTYANQSINFARRESKIRLIMSTSGDAFANGFPNQYVGGISVLSSYVGWQMVSYGGTSVPNPYYRKVNDTGVWDDWKQLAFLTDNVASATKLQDNTAYTAWGQTFFENGKPKSVSGNLHLNVNRLYWHSDSKNYCIYSYYDGSSTYLNIKDYGNILFHTSATERMRIINNGNVLIGTTMDSGYKLQVAGNVFATNFIGNLDGTYVNKLTGYTKATAISALADTDTLNIALGKLEYKADVAYNLVKGAYDGDETIENLAEILKVLEGISDTETIQAIVGKYLPLSGGTFNAQNGIGFRPYSAVEGGGGWALNAITFKDRELTKNLGYIGLYGNNLMSNYIYIGMNNYNGNNLRVASDNVRWGDNKIIHEGNYTTTTDKRYLQLSGGILSDSWSGGTEIRRKNANNGYASLIFSQSDGTILGRFGFGGVDNPLFITQAGGYNTLIHSGNANKADVSWTASNILFPKGTSATWNIHTTNSYKGITILNAVQAKPEGAPDDYAVGLSISGYYGFQLASLGGGDVLVYRRADLSWKTIAFTDSNVASATKLQTARTIWGQSFDGTGNVDGVFTISGSGHATFNTSLSSNHLLVGLDESGYTTDFEIGWRNRDVRSVVIKANGNVLMGTATDNGAKLQVNGTFNATTIYQNGQTLDKYYLPLNGGTISGGAGALSIKRTASNAVSLVKFENNDGVLGYLGIARDKNPIWYNQELTSFGYLIHSGNIGDYAFIPRTQIISNTNADTLLNGVYLNATGNGTGNSNFPNLYSVFMTFAQSSHYVAQFAIGSGSAYVRRKIDTWSDWKTIAFTDSDITGNAESATKLQTSRTIWGQSFDGTGNVAAGPGVGLMSSVGNYYGLSILPTRSPYWGVRTFLTYDEGATMGAYEIAARNHYGLTISRGGGVAYDFGSIPTYITYTSLVEIRPNGNVLIGTTTDAGYKFAVNGSVAFGNASGCDVYLQRIDGYSYIRSGHSIRFSVNNSGADYALELYNTKGARFYGSLQVDGATTLTTLTTSGLLTANAGINTTTLTASSTVTASSFIKAGSSDSYVLLGGGGHKAESSLSVNYANSSGNTDTVDGYHASSFVLKRIKTANPTGTAVGWYRCAQISSSNAGYSQNVIISLQRGYNSPQNEHYIFAISIGYKGQVSINQLSGCVGGQRITKVRVVYNNSGKCYFDYYMATSNYTNSYKVEILAGDCVSCQEPTLVSTADGTAVEFVPISGMKSNYSMYAPSFYQDSDQTLKTNIQAILNSDNMPIIKEFDWKSDGTHSYGLIAQELEERGYYELVNTDGSGNKTVNYSAALSLIVGKLQVKIKELEKEIETLKNKN